MPSLTRPTTAHHRMPHRLTYTARRTFSLGRNLRFFRGDTRRSNERSRLGDVQRRGRPKAAGRAGPAAPSSASPRPSRPHSRTSSAGKGCPSLPSGYRIAMTPSLSWDSRTVSQPVSPGSLLWALPCGRHWRLFD